MSAVDVRRPWLPAGLAAHGLGPEDVARLTYLVVDEIVDSAVTLTVCPWPAADGMGRLRFAGQEQRGRVTVPLGELDSALYAGWLRRAPRVGDAFGAVLADAERLVAEDDVTWTLPLRALVPGPVYDVTQEARTVAKLAWHAAQCRPLPAVTAHEWGVDRRAARPPRVPVRRTVGPRGG